MYATTGFPHHLHWSSHELADAVPRRLSELSLFDARGVPAHAEPANGEARPAREAASHYLPASTLPALFRVH